MKQFLVGLILLIGVTAQAQDYTSGNLIGPHNLTGTVGTNSAGAGFSGGNVPGYNSTTNTIMFGYTQSTVAYTYALSQALQSSGIVFTGFNYSWDYINHGDYRGTLSAGVNFIGINGATLYSRNWALGQTGATWQTVTGTETFTSSILTSNLANFSLSFTGRDDRFWAGYYGPQVRNPSLSINYSYDQCATNPLSSPTCAGYAEAYQTQQCNANALYSPSCPGYAAAYLTYQCSINPLYSTTCAGYTQAYYNQQCTLNPLYDTGCSGYKEAYALKNVIPNSTTTTTTIVLAQATTDPAAQAAPLVADPTVNSIITTRPSTNADANPAAPVKLTAPAPATPAVDSAANDKKSGGNSNNTQTAKTDSKPGDKPKTAREQLVEKQREKAKTEAVTKGKELANEMGKAADMAAQVEVQNVVIQAMGFTPGFDAYNKPIPDGQFYRPYEAYPGQRTIDTPAGRGLFGGSDNVHQDMVDRQYNLGK